MKQDALFDGADDPPAEPRAERPKGAVRLEKADRAQGRMETVCLDDLLPAGHRARSFWVLLDSCDLSSFKKDIRSTDDHAGRAATDPQVLLCLWLYAISEGIGSARHLARLCERDAPYRWIAGGLTPNYHTLSSFRVDHGDALDELLTELLAGLVRSGVISLRRVSQDGTKVRAKAGAASFRRERSLKKALKAAKAAVKATKLDLDKPARDDSKRRLAAQARAAVEREKRVKEALKSVKQLRGGSQKDRDPDEVRASTTDADARVMRMADGGYRPAVNVQTAVDTESRMVIGVKVTNVGSDLNEMAPMLDEVERRTGKLPTEHLVDGGYAKKQQIEAAAERGVAVYAPPPKRKGKSAPAPARWDDGPGVTAWRERMKTEQAQTVYRERAATAETVYADWRQWRGLKQMPVKGIGKSTSVILLMSLTYNFIRMLDLGVTALV